MSAAQGDWQGEVFRELEGGAPRGGDASRTPGGGDGARTLDRGDAPRAGHDGAGPGGPGGAAHDVGAAHDGRVAAHDGGASRALGGDLAHVAGRVSAHPLGEHAPAHPPAPGGPAPVPVESQPQPQPPPGGLALPSPESVPVLGAEFARARGAARRGDGVGRRWGRAVVRLVSSAARESAVVTEAARAIQQPVTTGRQIAVTSIRGGCGKSTVAALLSLTYAHYRSDPVLAVEADPALGTLPRRLGATEVRWTGADLARMVDPSMRLTDLTGYLVPHAGGGWLLPGSQGAVGARFDVDAYRTVMTSVRRYFGTTVVDCETLPAVVARTALTTTQARVLVCPASAEGVAATRAVLDWVGGLHRSMLPSTVVVVNHTVPDAGLDVRRAVERLADGGACVVTMPYDRHLAPGGEVRTRLLARRTVDATARLAAAVLDRAMARERRR
ncbi:hypothetical protein [Streptomyces sp. NPDC057702]|uniref:hypothetical protein n=1 Tax=unclassified Streptomyces TaxID=2593676 RepID=UPI0036B6E70E